MPKLEANTEAVTAQPEVSCDVCGTDYDPTDSIDLGSSHTCPACTSATMRTHGRDFVLLNNRRR